MSGPRSTRSDALGAIYAGLLVVAFCLILFWRDPLLFWNDDYEISILPVFADMARSWSEGHWPLLSPYSWVCSNLAGEFQYGTFSIFINAAVVLIWKFALTFPQQAAALSITHLFVLATGAFLLARDRRFSVPLSIFVALVTALSGWIFCWGATDWFGALAAFTWLPWAWWGLERALDRQRTRWRFLWPAAFVYLLVTGGFPYTVGMLVVLIAWLSIKSFVQTKNTILPMWGGAALGFGLAAPAWLALFEYVHDSARDLQASAAHWQWIVPWRALPGFILPCWTVDWVSFSSRHSPHTATELACGLVAPAALIAGFIWRGRVLVRRLKWELVLLVVLLLLCMLPTAGLFRWSFRWLPFFHLVLAICAADVLQMRPGPPTAVAAMLTLIAATVAMSIFGAAGRHAFPVIWIFLALTAMWVAGEFFLRDLKFREWAPAVVSFGTLLATYLCLPTNCGVPKYNFSQELAKPAPLDPQRLYLSLYPWAEIAYRPETKSGPVGRVVRPGSTSMWAGLRLINGYSPIIPAGVAREFKCTVHGEIDWSVGKYLLEQQAGPDGELAKLGVDGIVVASEINFEPQPKPEWEVAFANEEGRVYHRTGGPFARARSDIAAISRVVDSRNRVAADVDLANHDQGALVTFSRPYFPGYEARLDGKKLVVDSYRGLFPIVEVPAGSHGKFTLIYRPGWLVLGGGIAVCCAGIFIISVVAAAVLSGRKHSNSLPPVTAAATN